MQFQFLIDSNKDENFSVFIFDFFISDFLIDLWLPQDQEVHSGLAKLGFKAYSRGKN
jgi:hypothetical protein